MNQWNEVRQIDLSSVVEELHFCEVQTGFFACLAFILNDFNHPRKAVADENDEKNSQQ
jgi:hypothetical protein